jgi:hypothetical protein
MNQKELLEKLNKGSTQTQLPEGDNNTINKKNTNAWDFLSSNLMKPIGVIAAETEALGKLIGSHKTYNPITTATDILSGKREYSFSKLYEQYGESAGIPKPVGTILGFVTDIAADPLNFLGVGEMTKLGKLAEKVSSLKESGEAIKKGSELFKQIEKSGYTAEQLSLAGSRIGQVQKKQRALISAFGKPIIAGEKVYDIAGKTTKAIKGVPVVSKTLESFGKILSTKTGNKELDDMVVAFDDLSSYRKEKVIETATNIQKNITKLSPEDVKLIPEVIENPEMRDVIKNKNVLNMADDLTYLFKEMKREEKKLGVLKSEIVDYFPHIKNKDKIGDTLDNFFNAKKYSQTLKSAKARKIEGTVNEINEKFGKDFFVSNPALAYATRGVASSKAVTAKEFLDEAGKKFFVNSNKAPITYIESTNPLYKGLKASPEVVNTVDKYIQGIKPEELKPMLKAFDATQNWWKSQALISPMYHTRNFVGNLWNNFLGGVFNPVAYKKAGAIQMGKNLDDIILTTKNGENYTGRSILELSKQKGVFGRGQFTGDIAEQIQDEMYGAIEAAKTIQGYNPLSQRNILFKGNKAVGSAVENNAKLAHFIQKLEDGYSVDSAAKSVKKYLFDYNDLTDTERKVFKRLAPFYTWTKKNIPLQVENLFVNPEKWALVPKVIESIESGSQDPETEKYMSDYLKENIPVKIGQDKNGNYQYFILGSWLPSAAAIDFLSKPLDNTFNMITPLAKAPLEYWSNKSTYFKNTFGESTDIEYYEKQPGQFLSVTMRKKTINLLRNIRILNDINKFLETGSKDEPENSTMVKIMNAFFGKAGTYNIEQSKKFYDMDTENKINELNQARKKASQSGNEKYVEKLTQEIESIQKERYSE